MHITSVVLGTLSLILILLSIALRNMNFTFVAGVIAIAFCFIGLAMGIISLKKSDDKTKSLSILGTTINGVIVVALTFIIIWSIIPEDMPEEALRNMKVAPQESIIKESTPESK